MDGISQQQSTLGGRPPLIAPFHNRYQAIKALPKTTALVNIAEAAIRISQKQYKAVFDLVNYIQAYNFDPEILAACTNAAATVKAEEIEQTRWGYDLFTFIPRFACSAFYLGPFLEILPSEVATKFFARNYFAHPWQAETIKAQKILLSFSTPLAAAKFALEVWALNPKTILDILSRKRKAADTYEFRRYDKVALLEHFFTLLKEKHGEPDERSVVGPIPDAKALKSIQQIPRADQIRLIGIIAAEIRQGKYNQVEDIVRTVIAADFEPEALAAGREALAPLTLAFVAGPKFRFTDLGHIFSRNASPFHVGPLLEMLPRPVAFYLFRDRYFFSYQKQATQQVLLTFSNCAAAVEFLLDFYRTEPSLTAIFFNQMQPQTVGYKFRRYEAQELQDRFFASIKAADPDNSTK